MMYWTPKNFSRFAALLLCSSTTALSQGSVTAVNALDMEELERIADIARDGTDPRFTASIVDESRRNDGGTRATPPVLVSIEGEPAFVYTRGGKYNVPEGQLEFVMRCRGNGVIDLSTVLWASPHSDPDTGKLIPIAVNLKPEDNYELLMSPYGQNLEYLLPVRWVETYPSHGLLVRVVGSARADSPFFTSLRGTTNLHYSFRKDGKAIKNDGEFISLSGGTDISTFRSDVAPLLKHCREGNANPMDRALEPAVKVAAAPKRPPIEVNLDFLPVNQSRSFRRILEGERRSSEASKRVPFLTYFAFHLAYWERCAIASDAPMDFYTTTPLSDVRTIGILKDDYESFVVGASVYNQISRAIYDEAIRNDFSFDVTTKRFDQVMAQDKDAWLRVFSNYGCAGEVPEAFLEGVRSNLPYLEYKDGSRSVVVDFGGASFDVQLSQPIDLEITRRVGAAEIASAKDTIFTTSYPGQVLRSIAVGNFAQVDRIEDEFIATASNPFGGDPDNPMSKFLRPLMKLESSMKRHSNIITAYALGRMHILGACGDQLTSYRETTVYWTEYTNGLNQYVSSSAESRRTDYASVPRKFDGIVRTQNSIKTSGVLSREMATIISRLSCGGPVRTQLEDNMIAYFNGSVPAHIGPIPTK